MIEILCVFDHSLFIEMTLASLMDLGIEKEDIIAFTLKQRPDEPILFDSLNYQDGTSLFDLAAIFATILGVIGASIGFRLVWGPIVWGIIASTIGFLTGFAIDYLLTKTRSQMSARPSAVFPRVILVIRCRRNQQNSVEQLLWKNHALGLTVIDE